MDKNILDYWEFPYQPRDTQIQALKWFQSKYEEGKKYFILEAPVGVGKSNIGITISKFLTGNMGNSYILTPQRILQEQYEKSFFDNEKVNLGTFYGKTNYVCSQKNTNCEVGDLVKPRCNNCAYSEAKSAALASNNLVMNYKLGLLCFMYGKTFKPRKLIIMDECHQLENNLVEFDKITISDKRTNTIGEKWIVKEDIDEALQWVENAYLPALINYVTDKYEEIEFLLDKMGTDLTTSDTNKIQQYKKMETHLDEVNTLITQHHNNQVKNEYVLIHDKNKIEFKRITGKHVFNNLVKNMADKFLFMSSTVLDKNGFCSDLGINPDETAFISIHSEFDPSNRPVFYIPTAKMNVKWNTDENINGRQKMIERVVQICNMHKNESGIIHTGNFSISKWLIDQLTKQNIGKEIFHHNPNNNHDRNSIINAYINSTKPSLLISPSITEGLDLKDDLARFSVFVKIPYGFLGDQWIKKRMLLSNEWYQRRALIDIIQGGGRVVRGNNDWGYVYILDSSWNFMFNKNQHMLPKWWLEAYRRFDMD